LLHWSICCYVAHGDSRPKIANNNQNYGFVFCGAQR
jgi:hypothetical protein